MDVFQGVSAQGGVSAMGISAQGVSGRGVSARRCVLGSVSARGSLPDTPHGQNDRHV